MMKIALSGFVGFAIGAAAVGSMPIIAGAQHEKAVAARAAESEAAWVDPFALMKRAKDLAATEVSNYF